MSQADPFRTLVYSDQPETELTQQLKECGVGRVDVTHALDQAVAMQHSQPYHLLIIRDGKESISKRLESCKTKAPFAHLSTLVCTACDDRTELKRVQTFGCDALLPSPPPPIRLTALISSLIKQKHQTDLMRQVRQSSVLEVLSDTEINRVAQLGTVHPFTKGQTIVQKGADGCSVFFCLSGQIEVLVDPDNPKSKRLMIFPGQPFGEISVLSPGLRTATCIAATDCEVMELTLTDLQSEETIHKKLLLKLGQVLAQRIRENSSPQASASKQSGEQREKPLSPAKQTATPLSTKRHVTSAASSAPASNSTLDVQDSAEQSPLSWPTGHADEYDTSIAEESDYEVLSRKVAMRSEFIYSRLPGELRSNIRNKLVSYWSGGKLAKHNPHCLWPRQIFADGAPRLLDDLHLVVCCPEGDEAYRTTFLDLPFTQRCVGLAGFGCAGTLLKSEEEITRYFEGKQLKRAIPFDMRIAIQRPWHGKTALEYLSHTNKDVRDYTLFLIREDSRGLITKLVRDRYPKHQILTMVRDVQVDPKSRTNLFQQVEQALQESGMLVQRKLPDQAGFKFGETHFFPDLTPFYEQNAAISEHAALFGAIGLLAELGPDYSGSLWGSKGGAEGAQKAARARYGLAGARSVQDLADAIKWADGE